MAEARERNARTEAELRDKIIKNETDMARVKIDSDSISTEKSKVILKYIK